jgi:hypothetical protein
VLADSAEGLMRKVLVLADNAESLMRKVLAVADSVGDPNRPSD